MQRFCSLILGVILILTVFSMGAQASVWDWQVYESDHFVIFYHQGYEFQAQEIAYYLETSLPKIQKITGNNRNFKTRIVLQDTGNNSNGYADNFGHKISLFTNSPSTVGNLSGSQSWFRLVSGHELTHINQLNNYSGAGAIMPKIFGDQLSPNVFMPLWLVEGITVYYESQITPYEGRLRDGYQDAIIACKAASGDFPTTLDAAYTYAYFPLGQYYGIGGVFMRYLSDTYGEEKIAEFFQVNGTNPVGFLGAFSPALGVDRAAKKVFGKDFPTLFSEWAEAEKVEHANWKIDGELQQKSELGYFEYLTQANDKLYYIKVNLLTVAPYQYAGLAELIEYDPILNKEKVLKALPSATQAYLQVQDNRLYYSCSQVQDGYVNIDELGFGITAILYAYDLFTGKTYKILTDEFKSYEILENGDVLYTKERRDAYGSEIWKYSNGEKIKLGAVDELIVEIERYKDHYIVVGKQNCGSWNISSMTDDLTLMPIIDTPWNECSISLDGDDMYYTANYDSEYGIYCYNLNTKEAVQLTQGGYSFDGRVVNGELYFKGITANGQALFKKALILEPYQLEASEIVTPEPMAAFVETLEQKSAFGSNLSYLIKSKFRFVPYLWQSEDGLSLNTFTIDYADNGLNYAFKSKSFMPVELTLAGTLVNTNKVQDHVAQLDYSLYRSSHYGVSYIDLTASANLIQATSRVGAFIGLKAPRQMIGLSVMGQSNTHGVNGSLNYRYMLKRGNLLLQGSAFHQYDKLVFLRGIGMVGGKNVNGLAVSADLTHKLVEVRKGFWNSTLYMADLYGGLFVDYSTLEDGKLSYGCELSAEVGMGFWAPAVPKIGIAVSEGNVIPYFGFSLGI